MGVRYLTVQEVLYMHREALRLYGGLAGMKDEAAFQSAVARPRTSVGGADAFPTLPLKAAVYFESFVRYHPFNDGNKRIAYMAAGQFLRMNGMVLYAPPETVDEFATYVISDRPGLDEIAAWLELHCTRDPAT